jgi:hypothetical protein
MPSPWAAFLFLRQALHEIQHGCKHLEIDLAGLELKVGDAAAVVSHSCGSPRKSILSSAV